MVSLFGCADSTRTKVEGTAAGALVGAGTGYAIGGEQGAAIGVGIGLIGGYFIGSKIAERKQEYADRQEAIREEIAYNQQLIDQARLTNDNLQQEIKNYENQLAFLQSKERSGKELTEMNLKIKSESQQVLQEKVQLAQITLEKMQQEVQTSQRVYEQYQDSTIDFNQWNDKLAELEGEKDILKNNTDRALELSRGGE